MGREPQITKTFAYQIPQIRKKLDITARTMDFDFKTILIKNQISNTRNTIEYRVLINHCSFNILKENLMGVGIGDTKMNLINGIIKLILEQQKMSSLTVIISTWKNL